MASVETEFVQELATEAGYVVSFPRSPQTWTFSTCDIAGLGSGFLLKDAAEFFAAKLGLTKKEFQIRESRSRGFHFNWLGDGGNNPVRVMNPHSRLAAL